MSALPYDVIVVGAGPVGASLALALSDADLDVVVLDARREQGGSRGERSLALSHGARLIFQRLDTWSALCGMPRSMTAITDIDVSQAGGFGAVHLHARDHDLPALGYVVRYGALQAALEAALSRTRINIRYGARAVLAGGTRAYAAVALADATDPLLGRVVVVADGAGASVAGIVRQRYDYRQCALVANVWCRAPHRGLAFERFTPAGPVALLPEEDHYGVVWTATPQEIEILRALGDAAFLERLKLQFGRRRSDFVAVADRRSFPLALEVATSTVATRCAVIGNAAQTLHPVAGQGFNLGLRDAYELARIIIDTPRAEIGSPEMLDRYGRSRRRDRLAGIAFTHGLLGIFGHPSPWLRWPRGIGLSLLDTVPFAKRAFTRAMLFGL